MSLDPSSNMRRLFMKPGGNEPGPDGEGKWRPDGPMPGEGARRGGVARPRPESVSARRSNVQTHIHTHTHSRCSRNKEHKKTPKSFRNGNGIENKLLAFLYWADVFFFYFNSQLFVKYVSMYVHLVQVKTKVGNKINLKKMWMGCNCCGFDVIIIIVGVNEYLWALSLFYSEMWFSAINCNY